MHCVLIGHVCIDRNTSEHADYTGWGSSVMYMAHYLQDNFAMRPRLLARYGTDYLPYTSDVDMILGPTSDHTLVFKNHTKGGHRHQNCEHLEHSEPPELREASIATIAEADVVCVTPLLPNFSADYVRQLMSHTRPDAVRVLLPQGYFRHVGPDGDITAAPFSAADEILPFFDIVVFSEEDQPEALAVATGWARSHRQTIFVVTQGPAGASWVQGMQPPTLVPTEAILEDQIVDSVGCGDVFGAALMYEYYSSHNISQAVAAGNRAAGAKLFQVPSRVRHAVSETS